MDLSSGVIALPFVGDAYAQKLKRLGIETIEDLLLHAPNRYLDFRTKTNIGRLRVGETVTVAGKVVSMKNIYTKAKKVMQVAEIKDESGSTQVVWFNQPFLIRVIRVGMVLSLSGKIGFWGKKVAIFSPEFEKAGPNSVHTGRLVPIYPETARVSSKWLRRKVADAFSINKAKIKEFIPAATLNSLNLLDLKTSISAVHFPKTLKKAALGRERLAFNELLFMQMKSIYRRLDWQKNKSVHKLAVNKPQVSEFIQRLPFTLTKSQERCVSEILQDLGKDFPMNRLLEGDVGSGKTVVAAIAAFVSFLNGYQTAIMAPTQILAEQHFNTLNHLFKRFKIRIMLVTSARVKADPGVSDIFVGTHSLIHKKVDFDKIALVVIDEQQRFGVKQRAHLVKKAGKTKTAPHVLTMTATPIPRTVALTAYGDLSLSTLDEMPKGRKKIVTWIVPSKKREDAYKWIAGQIKKDNTQAFVVCPLIEESQKETMVQVKAVKKEYKNLRKALPKSKIGLLHGRQDPEERKAVLEKFKKNKISILVSTPIVEVGIDIPNATIMVIEGADRFGLSQLHQLRGRVGRGKKKSYCLLFSESKSKKVDSRLKAMQKGISGFELAELDLKLRGPGEILGHKQHGFPELKIASWQDIPLTKRARELAEEAFAHPKKYKKLFKKADILK